MILSLLCHDYSTFTDGNVTLQVHFRAVRKPEHGVYRGVCVAQLLIVRELRDYMSIAGTPGKQQCHSCTVDIVKLRTNKSFEKSLCCHLLALNTIGVLMVTVLLWKHRYSIVRGLVVC